jgi:hypothetical protein
MRTLFIVSVGNTFAITPKLIKSVNRVPAGSPASVLAIVSSFLVFLQENSLFVDYFKELNEQYWT